MKSFIYWCVQDYLLNKRYLDKEADSSYVPTYEQIVHDSDEVR